MYRTKHAKCAAYNPNKLLDALMQRMNLHTDDALSKSLKVTTEVIRNIRCGALPVAASMLLSIQEMTGIGVNELRSLMGDRRTRYRMAYVPVRRRT